ncbi:MAG: hypothetical protein GYA02_14580 [Clostridiaceae bacterium]|nr:hypothetical protein [Clostridiaceae bacterium]
MSKFRDYNCIQRVSLDGYWEFTYTPHCIGIGENHIGIGEKLQIPKANEFTIKIPVQ